MGTYLIGGRLVAGGGLDAGEITIRRLVPKSLSCELVLNDAESITGDVTLPLIDPVTGVGIDLPEQLVPGRDFVGVMVDDVLVAAGPVWADPFSFPYTSKLTASGLWSYFDHRAVLPVLGSGQLPRDVTSRWTGLSLRTIAKRLVQQAVAHPGAGLPIDFEPDVAGDSQREYPGSDLISVGDALRNLTEVQGGPDIAFRPYITADRRHVRWALLTGDTELTQAGADWYWDVSAPTPHATATSFDRDGRELASRSFLTGATIRNELQNPIFADGDSGWGIGVTASSWSILEGSNPYRGSAYARWTAAGSGQAFFGCRTTPNVVEGERVTFMAAARAGISSRQMRVRIRLLSESGSTVSESYSPWVTTAPPAWSEIYHSVTVPAGAVSAKLDVIGNASDAGEAFACGGGMFIRTGENLPFIVDDYQLQAAAVSDALTATGFPLLEVWEDRSSVLRASTLQAYADESVLRSSAHMTTRAITARRDQHPNLGLYWPGDYASIRSKKTARGPAETVRERIVRLSFGADGDVTVELAPQRVVSGYPIPSSNRRWLADQLTALSRRIAESNRGA